MRIESGTTRERPIRIGIFLVMCIGLAGWFAFDGLRGWPNQNLEWARQGLPADAPEVLQINSKAVRRNLEKVRQDMTREQVRALLGEPTLVEPRQFVYVGNKLKAVIRLDDDGNVIGVLTEDVPAGQATGSTNTLVTPARVEQIEKGMSEGQVRLKLGEPAERHPKTWWYVGQAAYASIPIRNEKVAGEPIIQPPDEKGAPHSESDIRLQKILAVGLGIVGLLVGLKLIQVLRTRAVVDDAGVTLNRRHVRWEQMTELDSSEYRDKGWVYLVYTEDGDTDTMRLDNYHLGRFDEIVEAICERKGFTCPVDRTRVGRVDHPSPRELPDDGDVD
jgi:outer membrane protein assembly factor BamE (lipoprotein component of BamABCDE complex)